MTSSQDPVSSRKSDKKRKHSNSSHHSNSESRDPKKVKSEAHKHKKHKTTKNTKSSASASSAPTKSADSKTSKVKTEKMSQDVTATNDTAKKEPMETKKESSPGSQEDSSQESFKWWQQQPDQLSSEIKWNTLSHAGVVFPPEYEPLPSHVKLLYNGKPVDLPLEAEEVAGFFGAMIETEHAQNETFRKNFFNDFLTVLKEAGGTKCGTQIEDFSKCDFSQMYNHFQSEREKRLALSPKEKKALKEAKEALEEPYKFCLLDGRREQIGNFRIEPPGLFRGRGAHPKTGKLKRRVMPEQITLNLGKEAPIPKAPEGHQWGAIKHDQTVTWLAMWHENIMNSVKYVKFAQNSSLKGMSDLNKFEKARGLHKVVDAIREDYRAKLHSSIMFERQLAVATYLIDVFALRAGGEKGEDEADTVGCCSLRYEHVTLVKPQTVIFDFLGKDSIRYYQEVEVDPQVHKSLRIFKREPKKDGDQLFDRIDPSSLNKYFQSYMKGLTAKVFRTYNASKTMQDQLDLISNTGTVKEKVVAFNAANREVAILCNHQRTVPKAHQAGVDKIQAKIEEMTWQKIKAKRMMLQLEPKLKKDRDYFAECKDLTKEREEEIINEWSARELEKLEKKYQKDMEKLGFEKNELSKADFKTKKETIESDYKAKLAKTKATTKKYKSEAQKQSYEVASNVTVDKLKIQVEKLDKRIKDTGLQLKDKEDNSTVALGTSKTNYIDPRLTVMFSKKYDVPIERLFTKTLREKFEWAIESADENWRFYE